jgi:hypothetical protein
MNSNIKDYLRQLGIRDDAKVAATNALFEKIQNFAIKEADKKMGADAPLALSVIFELMKQSTSGHLAHRVNNDKN